MMPQSSVKKDRKVDRVMLDCLSELARYLIGAGITYPKFVGIARLAFFRAAAANARFRNDKLNQSAVAAMTGLTRAQVREFARQKTPIPSEIRDRIELTIEGWATDRLFSLPNDVPRKLRRNGSKASFEALVKKYGGDIPARSLLREMQRHGYVAVREGYVQIRKRARESVDEVRARRLGQALVGLLKVPSGVNPSRAPLWATTYEVAYPATSERGRRVLNEIVQERLREFMAGVLAAGRAVSLENPPRDRRGESVVTRTSVALISEELSK